MTYIREYPQTFVLLSITTLSTTKKIFILLFEVVWYTINYFYSTGNCRTLKFGSALRDKALGGHLVKSYEVNSRDDCEFQCYMESECMSINFGLGANGKYLCELSSSDHELHPQDLKHRSGFIYGSTLVRYNYLYINRSEMIFLCVCVSKLFWWCGLLIRSSANGSGRDEWSYITIFKRSLRS